MIAVIGGCILIGLSFVVRALQRVERALMTRPMPRPRPPRRDRRCRATDDPGERSAAHPVSGETEGGAHLEPVPPAVRPAASVGKSPEALQEAVPLVVEESDVSLLPKAPVRLDEENGEVDHGVPGRPNGSAQVKTAPRFTVAARPARRPLQPQDSMFNSPLADGARLGAGA